MTAGAFIRQQAAFRGWVEPGSPPSRYHLYVALACPWSHRTVIVRKLAGLEDELGVSYLHPYRDERGWRLMEPDANRFEFLADAYRETDPDYDGRISVPVLWDEETEAIVSNESADIVRMLDEWGDAGLYPEQLRDEIEELNEWIYGDLQNGVYRAGFARSQEAYDEAFEGVFDASSGSRPYWASAATWPVTASRWPTGACSRRSCASTPSTSRTSAATGAG